jgi:antitoxin FitA
MTTLTIRNIERDIKSKLRLSAATNGRSMEEEVRQILRNIFSPPTVQKGFGSRIHARFAAVGGVDLDLPPRKAVPRAAQFDDATAESQIA